MIVSLNTTVAKITVSTNSLYFQINIEALHRSPTMIAGYYQSFWSGKSDNL